MVASPKTKTETETRGSQDQDRDRDSRVPRPRPRPRLVKTGLETSRDQDSSLENSKSVRYCSAGMKTIIIVINGHSAVSYLAVLLTCIGR